MRALVQDKNFFRFIYETELAIVVHILRDSLLRGTGLNEEAMKNNENDNIILTSLLKSVQRLYLSQADEYGKRDQDATHVQ